MKDEPRPRQGHKVEKDLPRPLPEAKDGARHLDDAPSQRTRPTEIHASISDPKYADVRKAFERRNVPLYLMPYALGLDQPPSKESAPNVWHDLEAHNVRMNLALASSYEKHLKRAKSDKEPEYGEAWHASGEAWDAQDRERAKKAEAAGTRHDRLPAATPIGSYDIRRTKDLPPMSEEFHRRLREYPAAVNYGILMFTRSLREWEYTDERLQKFAQMFADKIEEKAFRANPNARDRTQYENAYWALLSLGCIQEQWDRKGRRTSHPEVRVNMPEVEKQMHRFLLLEEIQRLEKEQTNADTSQRDDIQHRLAALRAAPAYQEIFNEYVADERGADVTAFEENRPTTIVEALGNRLYVTASTLPITEDEIDAAVADDSPEAPSTEHLRGALLHKHRLLGRLRANLSRDITSADRDIGTLLKYLAAEGVWNDSVESGFDLIMKSVIQSTQELDKVAQLLHDARNDVRFGPQHASVFKTHEEASVKLGDMVRTSKKYLLRAWHAHHTPEVGGAELEASQELAEMLSNELEFLKDEAKDNVAALTAFQDKITSLVEHMSDIGSQQDLAREQIVIKMRLKAALDALSTYLAVINPDATKN